MSEPSFDTQDEIALPAGLRWLKTLVVVLTVVMIIGMVLIVGMLFVKMRNDAAAPSFELAPDLLHLPDGAPRAVTRGEGWIGVVTDQNHFVIFDQRTGEIIDDIQITLPAATE